MATNPVVTEPVVPVAQPLPEGVDKLEKQADGSYYAKLADGTEFKGTPEHVIGEIGKAKVETAKWAKALRDSQPAPVVTTPTTEEVENQRLQNYLLDTVAKGMGLTSGDDLRRANKTIEQMQFQILSADFARMCPDFPSNKENQEKLFGILEESGVIPVDDKGNWKALPTAAQMAMAHSHAVRTGKYTALTPEQIAIANGGSPQPVSRPNPAPIVPGTQPELANNDPNDPWRMDMNKLREQIIAGNRALRREG